MSIDFGGTENEPFTYPFEVTYITHGSRGMTVAIIRDSESRDLPIRGIDPQYADPFCDYLNSFGTLIGPLERAYEIFKQSDVYIGMNTQTEEENIKVEANIEKLGELFCLPRIEGYDMIFDRGAKIICFGTFGKRAGLVSNVWTEEMILRRFGEMLKEFGRNEKIAAFRNLLNID